ncbi:metalloregulator ArsR/SmtB family transcription factor [Pedobacter sp. KR3-3]|uniref:Metalloregulator ArsR/SmtB family transcription factor n=1 Tax=Pedobacter albus TaxID=3113905 RepID=A0ABU7I600_9SPHI|nr:metalloregulator ArsR/SmtB family transcription factor [Pedobacter sp. KR3-3]MEE1944897.1 metalloregulator ArsR/SmtB family transcription factor [Pedobacter sp. KR3-3]
MITRRDVFQAIADPTRREIIHRIAQAPLSLNEVAETFDISRQAVSKHIQILTECGLVTMRQQGRERFCEAQLGKLNEVASWVDQYKKHWVGRFEALDTYLTELKENQKENGTK